MQKDIKKKKILVVKVEEKDHRFLKRRVAELGMTMREYVLQALLEKIAREEKYQ